MPKHGTPGAVARPRKGDAPQRLVFAVIRPAAARELHDELRHLGDLQTTIVRVAPGRVAQLPDLWRGRTAACLVLADEPERRSLDLLHSIKSLDNAPPIIHLTTGLTVTYALEAMRRGAFDVLQAPTEDAPLRLAVDQALPVDESACRVVAAIDDWHCRSRQLTPEEHDVVWSSLEGWSANAVARRMNISEHKVAELRARAFAKLGVDSHSMLVSRIQLEQAARIRRRQATPPRVRFDGESVATAGHSAALSAVPQPAP